MNIRKLNEALAKVLYEDEKGLLKISDDLTNRLTFGYLGSEDKLPRFNSLEELEEYIKSNNSFPDNFFYKDALFTNDEYDMEGEYLSYGCPQLDKGIVVRTPNNRYSHKGNYAELEFDISEEDGWSYRFDLTYHLPKEVYLALYGKNESVLKEDSYIVSEKDECPIYNTVGCESCDMAAAGLCLIGTDIRQFKSGKNESVKTKKSMREEHSYTKDEEENNRFVKLYKKCHEYRKEHPDMEAYEIAYKLCFNPNECWVNKDDIAKTWADMMVFDGAKDENLIYTVRQDILDMIEEYLIDDAENGDFE